MGLQQTPAAVSPHKSEFEAVSIMHDYSGVVVLDDVGFKVRSGKVHALLGQNGSGKSTLIKVLTGAVRPTRGQLYLDGEPVTFSMPHDSQNAGIAVIHQNYNLFPEMSVEHNLLAAANNPPRRRMLFNGVDHRSWRTRVQRIFERLKVTIDPSRLVGTLDPAERKFVEIARAMLVNPRFLILDEPTASLEPEAAEKVLELIRTLRDQNIGIVMVSHRLDEVVAVADEVTVLRDGIIVANRTATRISTSIISELMTGETHSGHMRSSRTVRPEVRLALRGVSVGGQRFDLQIHAGEIVAVTGLVGSGAATLVGMIGGDKPLDGQASFDGVEIKIRTPRDAYKRGIGFIPEDRKSRAMVMNLSCAFNISMASFDQISKRGMIDQKKLNNRAKGYAHSLRIKMRGPNAEAASLSGGNQQKVVVAKLLAADVSLMAIEEPTQGVDIEGRAQVHQLLERYVGEGNSILLFSTDVDEVLTLADTIYVFRHGNLSKIVAAQELDKKTLISMISGGGIAS